VFFVCAFIPCPADKVQEPTSPLVVDFGVEDGCNFIFNFTINFDQRWWRLDMVWNGVWSCRFQLRDMEDWVDFAEVVRKL